MTARDRGRVEEREPKYKHGDVLYKNNNGSKIEIIDIVADQYKFDCGDEYPHYEFFGYIESNYSKEPVSEDLEEAAELYGNCFEKHFGLASMAFIKGAKWQKEQFEKNRLKHCNSITNKQAELEQGFIDQHLDKYQRMPTFLDAIEYGMRLQKQQLMAKALDGKMVVGDEPQLVIPSLLTVTRHLDDGDKVKVIILKEG